MSFDDWQQELARVNMIDHALAYARRGWPVFPVWWPRYAGVCACNEAGDCPRTAKHPLVNGGHLAATTDARTISGWWQRWPHANIAIATGEPAGFTVLDIDPDHGGQDEFNLMMKRNGRPDVTIVSLTGGGGRHILWQWNEAHRCQQAVRQGLDVRSTGGYILVPPSMHASGIRYEWHRHGHPRNTKIAQAPSWAEALLRGAKAKRNGRRQTLPSGPIGEGGRNVTLFKYACRFQRQALADEELADRVHALNKQLCKPPLPDNEVEKLISSAMRYQKGT